MKLLIKMPAPRMVSLKGSDFTGLGIECYGGLKDGIYVKKVAPQGPASTHVNIGKFLISQLFSLSDQTKCHYLIVANGHLKPS